MALPAEPEPEPDEGASDGFPKAVGEKPAPLGLRRSAAEANDPQVSSGGADGLLAAV